MELDIKFKRNLIRMGLVSIKDFIFYASRIQKCLNIIGRENFPDLRSNDFSLLIKERKEGSQIYELVPQKQTQTFGITPIHQVVTIFSKISKLLETDQEGSNYKEVKGYVKNSKRRSELFNAFHALSRDPNSFVVDLKKTIDSTAKTIFYPKKKYRSSINSWKDLEIKKREEEFIGALTKIQIEGEIHFRIRDMFGNSIKHRFIEPEINKYRSFFTEVVKVRGLYNPVRNLLETIEKIELHNEIFLNKLKEFEFNYPLKIELKFMEDSFFAFNKDLNLRGVGKTFKEMEEDLYLDLCSACNLYVMSGKELTLAAKKIKSELVNLIKPESLYGIY